VWTGSIVNAAWWLSAIDRPSPNLRGNTGGSPGEVAHLLGALVHDRVYRYACDGAGQCTPVRTDGTLSLLGHS
jgi:hypothetical protein